MSTTGPMWIRRHSFGPNRKRLGSTARLESRRYGLIILSMDRCRIQPQVSRKSPSTLSHRQAGSWSAEQRARYSAWGWAQPRPPICVLRQSREPLSQTDCGRHRGEDLLVGHESPNSGLRDGARDRPPALPGCPLQPWHYARVLEPDRFNESGSGNLAFTAQQAAVIL